MNTNKMIQSISQTMITCFKETQHLTGRLFLVLLLMVCVSFSGLSQDYVTLDEPVSTDMEVTAQIMVSMVPGFNTAPGILFSAYIDTSGSPPAAPSLINATSVSSSSIHLTWTDGSTNEDEFVVMRSESAGSGFDIIANLPADSEEYTDTGLVELTTYYYKVFASNTYGTSDTVEANATTTEYVEVFTFGHTDIYGNMTTTAYRRAQPVTMPEDGTIQSVTMYHAGGSGDMILAVYDDLGGYPGNRIGITPATAVSSTTDWQEIYLTTPVEVTGGEQIWLAWVYESIPGVYYISGTPGRASSTDFWSGGMPDPFGSSSISDAIYSIYASYTVTPEEPVPPSAPTALSCPDVTSSSIHLIWTDGSTNEDEFLVMRSESEGSGFEIIANLPADSEEYSDTGLVELTTYYYRIFASNVYGTSDTVMTNATTLEYTEVFTFGNTEIYGSVSTTTNRRAQPVTMPEDGIIQSISMYHNGGSGDMILAVYDDQSGYPGNRIGITPVTAVSSTTGWQEIALVSPVEVSGGDQIWLAFVYETIPGVYFTAGSPGRANSPESWSGGMPDPFGSSGLYDYIYSIYASYVVSPQLPIAPTNLSYSDITSSSVHLTWIDNSLDETQFIIERSLTSGSGFIEIDIVSENSTSYTDYGLEPGTNYYYQVRAKNTATYSEYSNELHVSTPLLGIQEETVEVLNVSQNLNGAGDSAIFSFEVNPNAISLHISLHSISANYDLYGRVGSEPTTTSYDWYESDGGEVESLTFTDDYLVSGTWYLMVYSPSLSGWYDLTCTITYPVAPPENIPDIPISQDAVSYPSDMNYIQIITYREPTTSSSDIKDRLENFQYFDGLGRLIQSVDVGTSPKGYDVIQAVEYDPYGRESIKYLPYVKENNPGNYAGSYQDDADIAAVDYYMSGNAPVGKEPDNGAYIQIGYDNSPLNRVVSEKGPGAAWNEGGGKPVQYNYLSNTTSVSYWNADGTSAPDFEVNTLYVTETIDEQENITREYKDKQGRVVQKEAVNDNEVLRTAYVYDDFGRLSIVVPPAADEPTASKDDGYCYYYEYDKRGRMIAKKLPGAEWVYLCYDKLDRLVLTQDGKIRSENSHKYYVTKYDVINRPVMTGTVEIPVDLETIRTNLETTTGNLNEEYTGTGTCYGYSQQSSPVLSTAFVLTVTYYDNYNFVDDLDGLSYLEYTNHSSEGYASDYFLEPKGQVTGSMTRLLDEDWPDDIVDDTLFSVVYYDDYGNTIQTISENHLGGRDFTYTSYKPITFEVEKTEQQHVMGTESLITLKQEFEYDHTGRLLETRQRVNEQDWKTVSAMRYNELGELVEKYLHSNTTGTNNNFLQKIDYRYNVRGWLTDINDPGLGDSENDLFGMKLYYENIADFNNNTQKDYFNGNISAMEWNTKNDLRRGYAFEYDSINRFKLANYSEGNALDENTGHFSVAIDKYDMNGNIMSLTRKYNNILVDDLTYNYIGGNSNQIQTIDDAGTEVSVVNDYMKQATGDYQYDDNGNMITDPGKNSTITYNYLNLPKNVSHNEADIYYLYDAAGTKRAKSVYSGGSEQSNTQYVGNIVYEVGEIAYVLTGEGRLVPNGTDWKYEYYLKDHLGNNRVTFTENGSGLAKIVQRSSYYPFGLSFAEYNANIDNQNKYLYNGKELQDDLLGSESLGWYDYEARMYDPVLGRFHTVDPLLGLTFSLSPYQYCKNNPIRLIDPDGQSARDVILDALNRTLPGTRRHFESQDLKEDKDSKSKDKSSSSGSEVDPYSGLKAAWESFLAIEARQKRKGAITPDENYEIQMEIDKSDAAIEVTTETIETVNEVLYSTLVVMTGYGVAAEGGFIVSRIYEIAANVAQQAALKGDFNKVDLVDALLSAVGGKNIKGVKKFAIDFGAEFTKSFIDYTPEGGLIYQKSIKEGGIELGLRVSYKTIINGGDLEDDVATKYIFQLIRKKARYETLDPIVQSYE